MDPRAPEWMGPMIAAVQPWCDEPIVAAHTFQVAGGWASGVSNGLIGALAGWVFRRPPKHVRERSGGLPDTVILALGRTKVFVFAYRVRRMKQHVDAPVRVWRRSDLMVETDVRRVASKLTIDVLSTGDHHELESTSMTGRLGVVTKGIFSMLENTDVDPPREKLTGRVEEGDVVPPAPEPARPPSKKTVEKRRRLGEIAGGIEAELKRLGWWQDDPPSEETAVAGGAFGRETVAFSQWLQVVFVKRLRQAAAGEFEIPRFSQVSTYATREFDGYPEDLDGLMKYLYEVDRLV